MRAGLRAPAEPKRKKSGTPRPPALEGAAGMCRSQLTREEAGQPPVGDPDICQASRTHRVADPGSTLRDTSLTTSILSHSLSPSCLSDPASVLANGIDEQYHQEVRSQSQFCVEETVFQPWKLVPVLSVCPQAQPELGHPLRLRPSHPAWKEALHISPRPGPWDTAHQQRSRVGQTD